MLNCTQKQGGNVIGKLTESAELKGKLAPTTFSCSYLVTVSSTLEGQKFYRFRHDWDYQSLTVSGAKDLNLQLSGTRKR